MTFRFRCPATALCERIACQDFADKPHFRLDFGAGRTTGVRPFPYEWLASPMPPQTLYDISGIDLNRILYDQEDIRANNPQRGDMEMLNAIVFANPDQGHIIGYKDIGDKEFWVEGHIPGRPLVPGVLMIEAGAQLASYY